MRPNALLITDDWQLYSAMRYAMDVEHQRPDIEAIHVGFLLRNWYYDELTRTMPVLARDSRREFHDFALELDQFDKDPEHVDYTVLNGKLDDLLISLVTNHLHRG